MQTHNIPSHTTLRSDQPKVLPPLPNLSLISYCTRFWWSTCVDSTSWCINKMAFHWFQSLWRTKMCLWTVKDNLIQIQLRLVIQTSDVLSGGCNLPSKPELLLGKMPQNTKQTVELYLTTSAIKHTVSWWVWELLCKINNQEQTSSQLIATSWRGGGPRWVAPAPDEWGNLSSPHQDGTKMEPYSFRCINKIWSLAIKSHLFRCVILEVTFEKSL